MGFVDEVYKMRVGRYFMVRLFVVYVLYYWPIERVCGIGSE